MENCYFNYLIPISGVFCPNAVWRKYPTVKKSLESLLKSFVNWVVGQKSPKIRIFLMG